MNHRGQVSPSGLVDDEKVSAIGAYARDELGPRLARLGSQVIAYDRPMR
ncbi:hypothetical protein [Streptomyces sp. SID12488]|nr:hypothetical protein [Streptomyces sp. SID12488]NEA63839.1 hypothetical protein [Streptomyces sp. SID12488]